MHAHFIFYNVISTPTVPFITPFGMVCTFHFYSVARVWIMQFVEVQCIMQQADNIHRSGWSQEISQDYSVPCPC